MLKEVSGFLSEAQEDAQLIELYLKPEKSKSRTSSPLFRPPAKGLLGGSYKKTIERNLEGSITESPRRETSAIGDISARRGLSAKSRNHDLN